MSTETNHSHLFWIREKCYPVLMPLILSEDLAASRAPTGNVYICICAGQDITSIGSFAIWCEVNIWPLYPPSLHLEHFLTGTSFASVFLANADQREVWAKKMQWRHPLVWFETWNIHRGDCNQCFSNILFGSLNHATCGQSCHATGPLSN